MTARVQAPRSGKSAAAQVSRRHGDSQAVQGFLQAFLASPVQAQAEVPSFAALDPSIRAVYEQAAAARRASGATVHAETVYLEEASAAATDTRSLDRDLSRHALRRVPNDGNGVNDCLLISLLQHATGEYGHSHGALAAHFRDILAATPGLEAGHGERLTGAGQAARKLAELINGDPSVQPKLDITLVSRVGGVAVHDRIPAPPGQVSRRVLIVDQGGHFEAVSARPV